MSNFMTTDDVCLHFEVCRRTIERWRNRKSDNNPFPKPVRKEPGKANHYRKADVHNWSKNEFVES